MKVKYIFLSAIASVVALSSCSDALDMAPAGYIDMSTIWKDNDRVGAYLNAIYSGSYVTDSGILLPILRLPCRMMRGMRTQK